MSSITVEKLNMMAELHEELIDRAGRLHQLQHQLETKHPLRYFVDSIRSFDNGIVVFECVETWGPDTDTCSFSFSELANEKFEGQLLEKIKEKEVEEIRKKAETHKKAEALNEEYERRCLAELKEKYPEV